MNNRKQRGKIKVTSSTWTDLISGVPQRAVLASTDRGTPLIRST